MGKKHERRVDQQVRDALADLIESEVADPRVRFVTITGVNVSDDTRHATVHYTSIDPAMIHADPSRASGDHVPDDDEVIAGLTSAAPRLQGLLSRRVRLRNTPQLVFKPDPYEANARRVEGVLRDVPPSTGEVVVPDVYHDVYYDEAVEP